MHENVCDYYEWFNDDSAKHVLTMTTSSWTLLNTFCKQSCAWPVNALLPCAGALLRSMWMCGCTFYISNPNSIGWLKIKCKKFKRKEQLKRFYLAEKKMFTRNKKKGQPIKWYKIKQIIPTKIQLMETLKINISKLGWKFVSTIVFFIHKRHFRFIFHKFIWNFVQFDLKVEISFINHSETRQQCRCLFVLLFHSSLNYQNGRFVTVFLCLILT